MTSTSAHDFFAYKPEPRTGGDPRGRDAHDGFMRYAERLLELGYVWNTSGTDLVLPDDPTAAPRDTTVAPTCRFCRQPKQYIASGRSGHWRCRCPDALAHEQSRRTPKIGLPPNPHRTTRGAPEVRQLICDLAARGLKPGQIAVRLNAQGHRTVRGNPWTYAAVTTVLKVERSAA